MHHMVGGDNCDDSVRITRRQYGRRPGHGIERIPALGLAQNVRRVDLRQLCCNNVVVIGSGGGTMPSSRSYAIRSRLLPPTTLSSCLGMSRRDSGQSRLPEPPAMINT